MAEIAKSGKPSLASILPPATAKITGLYAGEDIAIGDACYVKSDGKIWRSTGAAANAAAVVDGFAATDTKAGEAVTLLHDVVLSYGAGLTPGAGYYLSGTVAGGLADAASTGGTVVIGRAIDASRVIVKQSY